MSNEVMIYKGIIAAVKLIIGVKNRENESYVTYLKNRPFYKDACIILEDEINRYRDLRRAYEDDLAGIEYSCKINNMLNTLNHIVNEGEKYPELGSKWADLAKKVKEYHQYRENVDNGYEEVDAERAGYRRDVDGNYIVDLSENLELVFTQSPPSTIILTKEGDENALEQYRELDDCMYRLLDELRYKRDKLDPRI